MKKIRDRNMAYDDYVINANRVWSARLYYKANGQWVAVSNDYVQSMTINDYVCDGSNLTMGCFAGSKATLQLKNVSASVSAALVENVRLKVELSLTTDTIGNVGAAVLQSPVWVIAENKRKKRQGNTYDCSLTVYDISYTMTRSYTQTADAMTASQVVTAVGQRYGLTVDSSVASMVATMDGNTPHTFGVIDSDIMDKQMLAYVAGYYGCYAEINESEQICFSWFKTSDEVIGPDRIYDGGVYVTEMTERTIVMLESGTSDNPIVAPDNAAGFSINFENPYMTAERATAIYNGKIANGKISFRIGKVRYKGNPVNNPGTILTVKDIAGESATFYIMKRTMRYDGGLSETIECMGESEQTVNYKVVSPTERKINRKLSRMEDAIKNATDVITQTKGSIYELIPVDENDPSKGNSGWKLHSTDESKQNVILANSSGIGFSSNGGQSFNAAAIYIDDQGVGHINANYINTGKLSADLIDTSELVISSGNVEGLSDKLSTLTSNVNSANATANSAKTTANNANTTASAAQTTANGVNTVIGQWCYNNDTTYINGGKIATGTIEAEAIKANSITADKLAAGAITAEKVNVGWQSGNLAADWYNPDRLTFSDYFTITTDSSNNYYSTVKIKKAYSGTLRCTSKSFYLAAGDMLKFGGTIYNKTAALSGFYIEYSSTSNGNYAVKVASNSGTSGTTQKNATYTATASGWYRLTCAFDNAAAGTYHSGVYCFHSVKGNLIVNGQIESTDGSTYFDLDKSLICTNSPYYQTLLRAGSIVTQARTSASSNYSEVGGVEAAVEINGPNEQTYQEIRWCGNANSLRIGRGNAGNIDPYLIFQTLGTVDLYKPLNAKAITSTEKISAATMSTSSAYASGFVHTRTSGISSDEGNTAKLIVGRANQWENMGDYSKNVVAIELSTGNTVYARMNVSTSWGSACGVITLDGSKGISAPLELGKTGMWFNGNSLTNSSSEKYKTDILPYTGSALSLVKSSVIYSYKYKSDGENALTKYGLVIERECPQEVVDNSGDAISIYSMCSILWKSVQELNAKVEALGGENNA